jgi:hypothetical protein
MNNQTRKGFADAKSRNLTADEHRALAERLHRAATEIKHVFHLIRERYPTTARVRFAAANVVSDITTLRMSLAGVVNAEMPSAGVDYLSDRGL